MTQHPLLNYWILDENRNPVRPVSPLEYALFMDDLSKRKVAETKLSEEVSVSTVFLGIDHNYTGHGPPVLFETMVFGGANNEFQRRYTTWKEAAQDHERIVALLRQEMGIPPPPPPPEPPAPRTWHERLCEEDDD